MSQVPTEPEVEIEVTPLTRRQKLVYGLVAAIVVAGLLYALYYYFFGGNKNSSGGNTPAPAPTSLPATDPFTISTDMQTSPQNDGNGQAIYLDRQNVSCTGGAGISQFQLNLTPTVLDPSTGLTTYQYKYKCLVSLKDADVSNTVDMDTGSVPYGQQNHSDPTNLQYLNVDCGDNSYLTQFKLYDNNNADALTYGYKYKCRTPQTDTLQCRTVTTDTIPATTDTRNLSGLNVACNEDEVLNGFTLVSKDNKTEFAYQYKCCKKVGVPPS